MNTPERLVTPKIFFIVIVTLQKSLCLGNPKGKFTPTGSERESETLLCPLKQFIMRGTHGGPLESNAALAVVFAQCSWRQSVYVRVGCVNLFISVREFASICLYVRVCSVYLFDPGYREHDLPSVAGVLLVVLGSVPPEGVALEVNSVEILHGFQLIDVRPLVQQIVIKLKHKSHENSLHTGTDNLAHSAVKPPMDDYAIVKLPLICRRQFDVMLY